MHALTLRAVFFTLFSSGRTANGLINYDEFVNVVLSPGQLPPPVEIPAELKPYYDQVVSKDAGKHKE